MAFKTFEHDEISYGCIELLGKLIVISDGLPQKIKCETYVLEVKVVGRLLLLGSSYPTEASFHPIGAANVSKMFSIAVGFNRNLMGCNSESGYEDANR